MKKCVVIVLCILTGSLAVSCASTTARSTRQKWNQAEILNLVSAHQDVRKDWLVSSIEPHGTDTITVWLADVVPQPNDRQVVVLSRQADGSWQVVKVKTIWRS